MRDLGRRLLIALAVVTTAVMAVGYAFVFSGGSKGLSGSSTTRLASATA